MNVGDNILKVRETIPYGVELVAVSKFHPNEAIMDAYGVGQRVFGESRATELKAKATSLPDDIKWHFIGHLQTNKVRMIMPYVSLIHSVDSERLLRLIDAEAARINKVVDVLLQVHVAQEETKFGFTPDELLQFVESGVINELTNVRVVGVMGMATNTNDVNRITEDFKAINQTFQNARALLKENKDFAQISMGMSDDYQLAIENGSTMVRIGSTIFGYRQY
ncbi:MAG: YggS family pyridoxal phosphate-dependent enzyme [Muribaculaceae bacterium]|nr:YggS family pyridoxal phosphate-dependent enzyme [Muribaculaceae bacterium]